MIENMKNKKQILLRVYLFISALMVLNVVLYCFWQMSFTGYWSDRVIFWIWLIVTPILVFLFWRKLWAKIYFWLLIAGLVLSILPMALPFFAIYLSGSGRGRLNHFNLENNIRVQTVGYGVMGKPRLQIVKDGLLFDKILLEYADEIETTDSTLVEVKDTNEPQVITKSAVSKTLQIRDAVNAKFISQTDSSVTIKYFFEKDTLQTEHILKEKTSFNY